jgi:uncharacterized repeat protein (TIGR02543 family)
MKAKKVIIIGILIIAIYGIAAFVLHNANIVYKVTFSVDNRIYFVTDTKEAKFPQTPTKSGYYFSGWFTDYEGKTSQVTQEFFKKTRFIKDIDLYAAWSLESSLEIPKTEEPVIKELEFSKIFVINPSTESDNEFKGGSSSNSDLQTITDIEDFQAIYKNEQGAEKTLLLIWKPENEDTIFGYVVKGSSELTANEVIKSMSLEKLQDLLKRPGYSFSKLLSSAELDSEYVMWGISDSSKLRTILLPNTTVFFIVWSPVENLLFYDGNGADGGEMEVGIFLSDTDKKLDENEFYRNGYNFLGWAESPDGEIKYKDSEIFNIGISPSVTLYAKWGLKENTIRFYSESIIDLETQIETQSVLANSQITITTGIFNKHKYILAGWATRQNGQIEYREGDVFETSVDRVYEFFAVWEFNPEVQYTIQYYLESFYNDQYLITNRLTTQDWVPIASKVDLDVKKLTLPNYVLNLGISTLSFYARENSSNLIKLYYNSEIYSVVFAPNGGTFVKGEQFQAVKYLGEVDEPILERKGYKFIGWDYDINRITSDCQIGAVWTAETKIAQAELIIENKKPIDSQKHSVKAVFESTFVAAHLTTYATPINVNWINKDITDILLPWEIVSIRNHINKFQSTI